MFTRILNTFARALVGISHRSVKHHDPDIRLFENDRAACLFADEANAKAAVRRFRARRYGCLVRLAGLPGAPHSTSGRQARQVDQHWRSGTMLYTVSLITACRLTNAPSPSRGLTISRTSHKHY